jgi:geranylgeranyl transferase type-2 subunit beta
MTSSVYLDMLDELLRPGIAGLSEQFKATQIRFLTDCQQPDGGFRGRQGPSDVYYTEFAVRTLAWLTPDRAAFDRAAFDRAAFDRAAFDRAADYLTNLRSPPRNVIECFSLLSSLRVLKHQSPTLATAATPALDLSRAIDCLRAHLLPKGGLSRSTGDSRTSAYHTFLGSLCFQLLGVEMPAVDGATAAVRALERPDGGYAELPDQPLSQTSATAAAVAFLMMHDALAPEDTAGPIRFLAAMQAADGGLKAHAAAPTADLLSTFTGLVTLSGLCGFQEVAPRRIARFLQQVADPHGGFLACQADDCPDVEYTYYGIATLALLRTLTPSPSQEV